MNCQVENTVQNGCKEYVKRTNVMGADGIKIYTLASYASREKSLVE